MKNFLDRLEIVRGNLSVSAFAKACGVNQKTMDHLVKDERKPSVEVVISVCRAFGVSADWLLGLKPASATAGNGGSDAVNKAKLEGLKAAIRSLLEQY